MNEQQKQVEALSEFEKILIEMNQTPMGRRTFLASVGFLMAACSTPAQHRQREGDNIGQNTSMTVADEKRMTQEVMPQMQKDYPPLRNSEVQTYVSNLGRRIASNNQLEGNPYNYTFAAVDVNYVNAFALPAGTIFVTAPLIAMAETEAELAGVVGHEIGHIQARHTAERMEAAKKAESKSWMYAVGGGFLGAAAGYGLGKLLCKPKDDKCLAQAATYGAAAGAGGGLLVQKYAFMANSREDEMEADRIGFRTSVRSGYSKNHVGLFYEKLLKMEEQSKGQNAGLMQSLADAMSTHPPSRERVQQMNQMVNETSAHQGQVSTMEFERIRKICQQIAKQKTQG